MDEFEFPVEIVKTGRKRSASIYLDGEVVKVRVPKTLSEERIHALLQQKAPWIRKKLREMRLAAPIKPKEYVSGETFCYLGKNYRLKIVSGEESPIKLKRGYLQATIPDGAGATKDKAVKSLLTVWYTAHAGKKLVEKTKRYAKILDVSYKSVSVRYYKSRWGSCSRNGEISYNWRLIMAPHRIVDYVVVHELCHLLEHSHSPRYWRYVEAVIPDFRDCRKWLREHSQRLEI